MVTIKDSDIYANTAEKHKYNNDKGQGGSIYVSYGRNTINLDNVKMYGNKATYGGGMVAMDAVNIADCEIYRNTAEIHGGGILVLDVMQGNNISKGNVSISSSKLYENRVLGYYEGDVNAPTNSKYLGNGGGIYVFGVNTSLYIENSELDRNEALYGHGGAIGVAIVSNELSGPNTTQGFDTYQDVMGNVVLGPGVTFSNNRAKTAYLFEDNGIDPDYGDLLAIYQSNIDAGTVSTLVNPYNNFDITYEGGRRWSYPVTVTVTDGTGAYTPGGTPYNLSTNLEVVVGEQVTLGAQKDATLGSRYRFDGWQSLPAISIQNASRETGATFVMPEYAVELTGSYSERTNPPIIPGNEYSVTVAVKGQGRASASATTAEEGTRLTLSYQPDEGYLFTGWEVVSPAGLVIGDDNSFTMPGRDVEVIAVFQGKEVTVSFAGADPIPEPILVTVGEAYGALPRPFQAGYLFTGWYNLPEAQQDRVKVEEHTLVTNPKDHTLYAEFLQVEDYVMILPTAPMILDVNDQYPAYQDNSLTWEQALELLEVQILDKEGQAVEAEITYTHSGYELVDFDALGEYAVTVQAVWEDETGETQSSVGEVTFQIADRKPPIVTAQDIVMPNGSRAGSEQVLVAMAMTRALDNFDGEIDPDDIEVSFLGDITFDQISWYRDREYAVYLTAVDSSGNQGQAVILLKTSYYSSGGGDRERPDENGNGGNDSEEETGGTVIDLDENGDLIVIDEDETPLGALLPGDDGEWVIADEDSPVTMGVLPHTGAAGVKRAIPLFALAVLTVTGSVVLIRRKRNQTQEKQ